MKSPFFIPGPPESVDRAEISQLIRLLDYISDDVSTVSRAAGFALHLAKEELIFVMTADRADAQPPSRSPQ
ncbi:hypothetical protein SAMN06297251_104275 [Fulvimarina manganoxydans]|uniref:Uncharacterized protein n=1 Tax=Fulvimarina manganoxydans TaxID=937218 RepID=A0A1W2AKY4_9HYPH|nr:hypothetical protein [Fulvimarina manganoxydans]MCK5934772.1 hypothetical protein [Fulvimarina manganoxydans]MEE2952255.1 hypothetical protein [Pseudomonadota bacterium]SMC61210.1 hypothetical protein SAMN06297251_104275 [Fulvimarina manganoxydans]